MKPRIAGFLFTLAFATASRPGDAQTPKSGTSFLAAYFQPGKPASVILFPFVGRPSELALPGLPVGFNVVAFSPDGKSIYGLNSEPLKPQDGITKIEFNPVRQTAVPGSTGLGGVWHLTPSAQTSKIYVTGWRRDHGAVECGAFEIDPTAESLRPLLTATSQGCAGAEGPLSPDGRLVVGHSGKNLTILDLVTRAERIVRGVDAGSFVGSTWIPNCSWSPDGQRVAAARDGRIFVIDVHNATLEKSIQTSLRGGVHWSPDSRFLLFARDDRSCSGYVDAESLAVLDLATDHVVGIESSRCAIGRPVIGWLERAVIQ